MMEEAKKISRPTNFFFSYSILLCHTSATFYESTLFCKKKTTTMSLDLLSRITQQELKEHELKQETIKNRRISPFCVQFSTKN
jgi:hypothetical protein